MAGMATVSADQNAITGALSARNIKNSGSDFPIIDDAMRNLELLHSAPGSSASTRRERHTWRAWPARRQIAISRPPAIFAEHSARARAGLLNACGSGRLPHDSSGPTSRSSKSHWAPDTQAMRYSVARFAANSAVRPDNIAQGRCPGLRRRYARRICSSRPRSAPVSICSIFRSATQPGSRLCPRHR